jgi:hypothetical protein
MHKYLPSKKFTNILLAIIFTLVIIYLSYFFINKPEGKIDDPLKQETTAKIQEFMVLDSDGDGLKDWEEALWKTDPQNPDTDGDKTSDGEEISINRDPLKQNINPANQEPSDKIDEKIIADEKKAADDYKKLNSTEIISRQLFSQYIANKKIGKTLTNNDMANILNNSLSVISTPVFKQFYLKDLETYEANEEQQIAYGNETVEVILKHKLEKIIDFNDIINSINEEDSDEEIKIKLQKFQPLIEEYHKMALDLLKIKVPTIFAVRHLDLINAFEQVSDNLAQIIEFSSDPIKMYLLIDMYPDSLKKLSKF